MKWTSKSIVSILWNYHPVVIAASANVKVISPDHLFLTKGSGSLFFESVMPDGFREGELV
jgi:hypothetical protein